MKIVAVLSAVNGAGSTTVAAHLATALHLQKRQTLAFDFCTDNLLRLHFGMPWSDHSGLAADLMQRRDWHKAAYRSAAGVDFVPFGKLDNEETLDRFIDWLKERPTWFANQLSTVQATHDAVVICDCPRMPATLREQVLAAADLVLLICRPETVSFASSTRIAAEVGMAHGPSTRIVLNGFDPSRRLDRDISVLLRTQHKSSLSPVVVRYDESLREALSCKQTVFDFAPSSQAAYDYTALATWTLARLGHGSTNVKSSTASARLH